MQRVHYFLLVYGSAVLVGQALADDFQPRPLKSSVTGVQPQTGIVLWTTNGATATAPVQLEFSYFPYSQVVNERGEYDWAPLEKTLEQVARRKHQLVLRWYDTYVGKPTGVPGSVTSLPGYRLIRDNSEGKPTEFPDWGHPGLRNFHQEFFEKFAEKYDRDARLAFVQVGFGLWSEYHIYDGPMILGQTFPSLEYQTEFLNHLAGCLRETPWMISIDAADKKRSPVAGNRELLALPFGLFDDSFNHAKHARVNEPNWVALGLDRWRTAPVGGEFSFYEKKDQSQALAPQGPHGISFETQAGKFHLSFILGDGQPRFQPADRVHQAGMACGYRFRVTEFLTSASAARVKITNTGIAPIYHDAFPSINSVRSTVSLKGLLPGETREFPIAAGGTSPQLVIESDRLVPGQRIEFDADL